MSDTRPRGERPQLETSGYEEARAQARLAERNGQLEAALEAYERAGQLAVAAGARDRADLETCNRCAVLVALGRAKETVQPLRAVLEQSGESENGFLAAYNLACAHYALREHGKAAFYARGAIRLAEALDRREWRAWGHNQLANALLSRDQVAEAQEEYEAALELGAPLADSVARAQIVANLGYCRVLLGGGVEAFPQLFAGLRTLRRAGAQKAMMLAHLDLAYAYLEVGRPISARRHAERGLALAERHGGEEDLRNATFLLGESFIAAGEEGAARECFDRLQGQYPGTPYLTELLLAVDVRGFINLRA